MRVPLHTVFGIAANKERSFSWENKTRLLLSTFAVAITSAVDAICEISRVYIVASDAILSLWIVQ